MAANSVPATAPAVFFDRAPGLARCFADEHATVALSITCRAEQHRSELDLPPSLPEGTPQPPRSACALAAGLVSREPAPAGRFLRRLPAPHKTKAGTSRTRPRLRSRCYAPQAPGATSRISPAPGRQGRKTHWPGTDHGEPLLGADSGCRADATLPSYVTSGFLPLHLLLRCKYNYAANVRASSQFPA